MYCCVFGTRMEPFNETTQGFVLPSATLTMTVACGQLIGRISSPRNPYPVTPLSGSCLAVCLCLFDFFFIFIFLPPCRSFSFSFLLSFFCPRCPTRSSQVPVPSWATFIYIRRHILSPWRHLDAWYVCMYCATPESLRFRRPPSRECILLAANICLGTYRQ